MICTAVQTLRSPCSLRRWKRGEPRRLFLNELSLVLQWAELEAARPPLPPGLEGGVSEAPPAPSALEEDEDEEEEGGVVEEGWWIWCTGVPSGVGSGEPCGVTCDTGGGAAEELEDEWMFLDLKTDGEGKLKKRGMGERSGEGDGEGERGVPSGRDFMEWRWGRSAGHFVGRVCVLGSGGGRVGLGVVALPGLGSLEEEAEATSDWLKVKTGL